MNTPYCRCHKMNISIFLDDHFVAYFAHWQNLLSSKTLVCGQPGFFIIPKITHIFIIKANKRRGGIIMLTMINKSQIIEISTEELDFYNALTNEVCYGFPIKEGKNKPTPTKRNSSGKYISCKKNECTWWKNYELCLEMEKLGQL